MKKKPIIASRFLRSVLVLTTGTALAQLVGYIITPLLTRLFTPEEFGIFGMYMRIATFLAAIGTARYELSLVLPKQEQHAFQLFRLSVRIALSILATTAVFSFFYWYFLADKSLFLFSFILLTLCGSFFVIFKNIGTNWAIRNEHFRKISNATVLGAITSNFLKLLAGWLKFGGLGLVASAVIGAFVGTIIFIKDYLGLKKQPQHERSKSKIKALSKTYVEFPKVNLPHILVDQLKELLIALIIIEILDTMVFGSFDHAFRMLKVPLALVGTSISQVFYQRCSEIYNQNKPIFQLVRKTVVSLAGIALIPFLIIGIWGESLFVFIFGTDWSLAGEMAQALTPWLFMNFIASPISTLPIVIQKQKAFFIFSLLGNFIQIAGFLAIPVFFDQNIITAIWWLSGAMSIYFLMLILWKFHLAKDINRG